ncbi:MAG TPA: arsenate reductase ArsC, partial [Dehalococcoidia bacterium]|nr:arsenate reductase ArsC [Dehalococcoidia bacterium]
MNVRPIRVLFLCTGNSARSIIAEAVLRSAGKDAFEVHSAGTEPKGINPFTVKVLQQDGIDMD